MKHGRWSASQTPMNWSRHSTSTGWSVERPHLLRPQRNKFSREGNLRLSRTLSPIDRDHVDPAIAAALLFLAAEQYADANEAATLIRFRRQAQLYEATILSEHINDLARGRLESILDRAERWRRPREDGDLEELALATLLEDLATGVEILAARFLGVPIPSPSSGRFDSARAAFERVLQLSATVDSGHREDIGGNLVHAYAGPHHLASLLLAAHDGLSNAA
jgi:hypothetical protein